MVLRRRQAGLGIDLGASAFKSVTMELRDGVPVVLACRQLSLRQEGILDEGELYATLASWLETTDCEGMETTVGLPQFLATTQLTDFPQHASRDSLEEMVSFETQQLSGLSEEAFVHDFHVMPAGGGRRNPILIGICRESVIRERMDALRGAGIQAPHLGMDGLAAVNSLLLQHAHVSDTPDPQLVIDIGKETSTLVVIAGGQPLYVGSLLFGAEKWVQAAMEREELNDRDAEAYLASVELADESPRSPHILLVRQLHDEILNGLEHWRAQERAPLNEADIAGAWICGGAARLRGLTDYLSDCLSCPVDTFGPVDPESGTVRPEFAVAHGLAAQSVGAASVTISLTPSEVRWHALREKRYPYLVAGAILLAGLLFGWLARAYMAADHEAREVRRQTEQLAACERIIPRLEDARSAIARREAQITPIVQAGYRSRRFVEALDALAAVAGENDWFVYLGDEASYNRQRDAQPEKAPPESAERPPGFPGSERTPVVGDTVTVPEFPRRILADDAPGMHALIVAGYTPLQRYEPWEPIRKMIDRLRGMEAYADVDLLLEAERVGREDIFEPWVRFLRAHPGALYKPFSIRLGFATRPVVGRNQGRTGESDE